MITLAGPFLAFAVLLVMSGALKLADRKPTLGALRAARLPAAPATVVAIGLGEIAIGVGAVLTGGPWFAAALALTYALFAGFVIMALARHLPIASCGCFGKEDTPPSRMHVAVTVVAAVTGAAVAVRPLGPIGPLLSEQVGNGIPLLLAVAVSVYLLYVILTILARTTSMVLRGSDRTVGGHG
jgi:uncharacterized membrane protein YphA (DoxX/SURF4 family)